MTNFGMLHGSIGPLQLIPLHNPGAMGGTFPHQHLLLAVIGVVAIIALTIVWMRHQPVKFESLFQAGWGLLFGGALGNTFDRLDSHAAGAAPAEG
ncbi:signal peptidase II [Alicyclobacillus dauci]|nr:signal peptidase II [Alicyclobacillus dauci]WAH37457.1 signal peptidase II [Alicyclobacillus dauci]